MEPKNILDFLTEQVRISVRISTTKRLPNSTRIGWQFENNYRQTVWKNFTGCLQPFMESGTKKYRDYRGFQIVQ